MSRSPYRPWRPIALFLVLSAALTAACGKKEDKKEEMKAQEVPTPSVTCVPEKEELARCTARLEDDRAGCEASIKRLEALLEPAPRARPDAVAEAEETTIAIGRTYVLGQGAETVVMNPKPVDDRMLRFSKGATCRYDPQGKVKIVGKRIVKEGDDAWAEYLVRYTRDVAPEALQVGALERPDAEPYECPTGTVFFLDDTSILEEDEPDPRYDKARELLDSEKP